MSGFFDTQAKIKRTTLCYTDDNGNTIEGDLEKNFDNFNNFVKIHYRMVCFNLGFEPTFNDTGMGEAFESWRRNIRCIKDESTSRAPGRPNHFEQAGALTYCLRHSPPVKDIDYPQLDDNVIHLKNEEEIDYDEHFISTIFAKYPDVFLAYDIGYEICRFYEKYKKGGTEEIPPYPKQDFVTDICYYLKFKDVSPDAMEMIYSALFERKEE